MSFFERLDRLFFPPACLFCDDIVKNAGEICSDCAFKTAHLAAPKAVLHLSGATDGACAVFLYSGCVRSALTTFKFDGYEEKGAKFAEYICRRVRELSIDNMVDFVTCAPATIHGRILAEEVAKRLNLPFKKTMRRILPVGKQHRLSNKKRRRNLTGAFKCVVPLEGLRALVVDDVVTTGSTFAECARALKSCGTVKVYGAAFAMSRSLL